MSFYIPAIILWILAAILGVVVLVLAAVGAYMLWQSRNGVFNP